MEIMSWVVGIWGVLSRNKFSNNPQKIAILFLDLGIGDSVMLSPIIQKIADIFSQSKVFLITPTEEIINFKNIEYLKEEEFKKIKKEFDLIISPTLCLWHFPYIFSAKNWIGYFAKTKIHANFNFLKNKDIIYYKPIREHYIIRGINLIKAIDKEAGDEMERNFNNKSIEYPFLLSKEPAYFKDELEGKKYLALAPVCKSLAKQWPLMNFVEICRYLFKNKGLDKIVLLGDGSQWDKNFISNMIKELSDLPQGVILDVAGKNTLTETIFVIKNSEIFVGLDSAPAHFAYLNTKRVLAIFVNINPMEISPVRNLKNVEFLFPDDESYIYGYSGLLEGDVEFSQKLLKSMPVQKAIDKINNLFDKR